MESKSKVINLVDLTESPDGKEDAGVALESKLKQAGIWHQFINKPDTVHSADASAATGIDLHRISKNLVCKAGEEFVLAIVPGDKKLSFSKLKAILGAKKVALYPFEMAEGISGYPPGATPSIFHKVQMRVVLDSSLAGMQSFYCGGGRRNRLLELKSEDVIKLGNALVGDITE